MDRADGERAGEDGFLAQHAPTAVQIEDAELFARQAFKLGNEEFGGVLRSSDEARREVLLVRAPGEFERGDESAGFRQADSLLMPQPGRVEAGEFGERVVVKQGLGDFDRVLPSRAVLYKDGEEFRVA